MGETLGCSYVVRTPPIIYRVSLFFIHLRYRHTHRDANTKQVSMSCEIDCLSVAFCALPRQPHGAQECLSLVPPNPNLLSDTHGLLLIIVAASLGSLDVFCGRYTRQRHCCTVAGRLQRPVRIDCCISRDAIVITRLRQLRESCSNCSKYLT